jgi:hypothetical protein
MKKITFIVYSLIAVTLFACTKTGVEVKKEEDLYNNSPATLVPNELAKGLWFSGTISPISYFDRDGYNLGNDYEAGREYQFSNVGGQGRLKFWQYLGTRNSSSCTAEYYTYKEGTVKFEGDKLTFYPVKGNFKTIKKGCSSGNGTTPREAAGDDLKPDTMLWELKTIDNVTYLYVYLEKDVEHKNAVFVYRFGQ